MGGTVQVLGGAIDQATPSGSLTLALLIDDSPVRAPLTRFGRADVCAVLPETSYPGACASGVRFDWNTSGLTGQYTVAVRVTDGGELSTVVGSRTVTVGP